MFFKVLILACIQGITELLPVSSSAHVIVAEKLMGLNPTAPAMTLLLVMLHTGTMLAVIIFFWKSWQLFFFSSVEQFKKTIILILVATIATGLVGGVLKVIIERIFLKGMPHAQIEDLFGNLLVMAAALAAVGALIISTGLIQEKSQGEKKKLNVYAAIIMGLVQGLCLPLRGFSRSGATISTGLILGIDKKVIENFSFALAVILTPIVILKELMRYLKIQHVLGHQAGDVKSVFMMSLIGMVLSFCTGFLALKWLSRWIDEGRWYLFGFYCLVASVAILYLHHIGY